MLYVSVYVNSIMRVPVYVIRCDFTNFPKHLPQWYSVYADTCNVWSDFAVPLIWHLTRLRLKTYLQN